MLIPERMLLHMLNTGEYTEDRVAGTITVIISKDEIYTAHVDAVWTELQNFIRVMNEQSKGVEGLMAEGVMTEEQVKECHAHDNCGHDHATK